MQTAGILRMTTERKEIDVHVDHDKEYYEGLKGEGIK